MAGRWRTPRSSRSSTCRTCEKVTPTFACPGSFKDPTDDILSAFNEILFRTSIHAGNPATKLNLTEHPLDPGLSLYQEVQVLQTSSQNVYRTVGWALWSAVAVTGIGRTSRAPYALGVERDWHGCHFGSDRNSKSVRRTFAMGHGEETGR